MHNPTLAKIKKPLVWPPSAQTGLIGLPCDRAWHRAYNSNITADHFYSVRA